MKNLKLFVVLAFILPAVVACKKNGVTSLNVSNADAAAILAGSTATNSYGVYGITNDISLNALVQSSATNLGCGVTKLDTISRHSAAGASATYSYAFYDNYKLNCNSSNLPDNITGNIGYKGYYSNTNLTLTNSGTVTYTLAGLTTTATVHSLNGEYKSSGSFKLKSDTTNTGTVNIDVVIKNLTISKSTQYFTGGTATVIITGTTTKKGDFTYNGTLTINTGSLATLVLNGSTYQVNLVLGTITPK